MENYVCNDPSHALSIPFHSQSYAHKRVLEAVKDHEREGLSCAEVYGLVARELLTRFSGPFAAGQRGSRIEFLRRSILSDWGEVFRKLDVLGWLTGWLITECSRDPGELHFVLTSLVLESNRQLYAILSQLRSALSLDTFGYLRTLHEISVRSLFLRKYAEQDSDLPGRYLYHINATYLEFYRKFGRIHGTNASDNPWLETERKYKSLVHGEAEGGYAWAYPLVLKRNGCPKKRPTFRDIAELIEDNSAFWKDYYAVSASKSHGEQVWNPLMVFPDSLHFRIDSFNVGDIGLVMDLMLPLQETTLLNTAPSCTVSDHAVVLSVVKEVIKDIRDSAEAVKAKDPELHGGV